MSGPVHARKTSKGRTYVHPVTGETAWSVTTILNAVSKPALPGWAAREVAEYAVANRRQVDGILEGVRISRTSDGDLRGVVSDPDAVQAAIDLLKGAPWRSRERAKNIGSAVHAEIEAHVLGQPRPEPALPLQPYVAQFRRFLADWSPEFLMSEGTVWNRSESYAGTLDWIARFGERVVLGDTKTGKDVYSEAALQLSAYRRAEFVLLPDGTEAPMPDVDGAVVLHLTPDDYRIVPVLTDDSVYRAFLYTRESFRWLDETSKAVLGAPCAGPDSLEWLFPAGAPSSDWDWEGAAA